MPNLTESDSSLSDSYFEDSITFENFTYSQDNISEMVFSVDFALKMVPEFSGNRAELHKFISCADSVAETAVTRENQTTYLTILKSKLTGAAYNLVKYKKYETYEALKAALKAQFLETRTIGQLQVQLLSSKQSPNETVRNFATRIEQLTIDLTDAMVSLEGEASLTTIENLNKRSALKAFQEGLQHPYKLIIKASRFTDLETAINAAIEEERSQDSRKSFNFSQKPLLQQRQSFPQCKYCQRKNHSSDRCFRKPNFQNRSNPQSNFQNRSSPQSNFQNRTNFQSNFQNKENFQSNSQNMSNFQDSRRYIATISDNPVCKYCHKVGHSIDKCRIKISNDNYRQENRIYPRNQDENRYSNNRNFTNQNGQSRNNTNYTNNRNYPQDRNYTNSNSRQINYIQEESSENF